MRVMKNIAIKKSAFPIRNTIFQTKFSREYVPQEKTIVICCN